MELSYNGFGRQVASFTGSVAVGDLVSLSGSGTVAKASADKPLVGVCVSKRGELAGVQLRGAVTIGYTGAAPAPGKAALVTAGNNLVKTAATGDALLVLAVDADRKTCTVLL